MEPEVPEVFTPGPVSVQEVASVEDQVSTQTLPLLITESVAARVRPGAGGGGEGY